MNFERIIFTIITYSGEARSLSMEAIAHAKRKEISKAKKCIEEAVEKLEMAHREQTHLIHAEAQGEKVEVSLLLIHAQDHLMMAMTVKDLANELIDIHEKIS
ncbi:PTS system, cellobiose-specific IIA component [Geosporobacter subterraneus DSM 17957]|uniref:PTS system, cellobiose-specific IIA component n=1 Tax=Geosporobacter subterraneus DSM 17957 TaxID=1121919 RepID=A0A1M6CQR4_9FIRM|nr:PTS lactose/cellobiose transporter subunit IIA [Geosporobacter subterraneus]SHI63223.1 PTS system, cellobiose-specific IIA component [Geosporobacter subterraneus DSM 17957]